jgi:hypothetical protein
MKWRTLSLYLKVATALGTLSAFVLSAGAGLKW